MCLFDDKIFFAVVVDWKSIEIYYDEWKTTWGTCMYVKCTFIKAGIVILIMIT